MWRSIQFLRCLTPSIHLPTSIMPAVRSIHSIIKPPQFSTTLTSSIFAKPTPMLTTVTPQLQQSCGFKVKGRLKRRCKDCYFVVREERLFVICKTHPRHKQMAMKARDDKSWILTHATQSKVRPY